MKYKEYYDFVVSYTHVFGNKKDQQHWKLGCLDEFGEVLGLFKKQLFKEVPKAKFTDEIGDVLFYLTMGRYHTKSNVPEQYSYVGLDNIFDLTKLYNEYWEKDDLVGMYCCVLNLCEMLDIVPENAYQVNHDKLTERHKGEFNIDNKKHTKEEQDAIK